MTEQRHEVRSETRMVAYLSPVHRFFAVDREGHPPTLEQASNAAVAEAHRILAHVEPQALTSQGWETTFHTHITDIAFAMAHRGRNERRRTLFATVRPGEALASALSAFIESEVR